MTERNGDRDEQLRGVAEQVALRTGLLRRCPTHGAVYDSGQHDLQGACMVASFLVNQSDPLVAAFGGDRAALTGLLRTIRQGYATTCPQCAPVGAG